MIRKLFRWSGNFIDDLKTLKLFRWSGNFPDHLETSHTIQKVSRPSLNFLDRLEILWAIWNLPDHSDTFQTTQKLSRSSGKYPAYPGNFQTIRKKSRLSGNFPKGPETSQCNFKGYAQKLSGRAKTFRMAMPPCHPGFWDSGCAQVGPKAFWDNSKFIKVQFVKKHKYQPCVVLGPFNRLLVLLRRFCPIDIKFNLNQEQSPI